MTTSWSPRQRPDIDELRQHTQKERVREILRSANDAGVCSLSFYSLGLPNGRTRIVELRDGDGLAIETFACDRNDYHRGEVDVPSHVRYRWLWNPAPYQPHLIRDDD